MDRQKRDHFYHVAMAAIVMSSAVIHMTAVNACHAVNTAAGTEE